MKKDHVNCIRLCFELFFIFVLPLILLFTFLGINKTFVYDNDGNFDSSSFSIVINNVDIVGADNPIIELLEFVEDSLYIDTTNNVVKFINCYNVLWFIMFLIWHLLYGIVDGVVHLARKSYATGR